MRWFRDKERRTLVVDQVYLLLLHFEAEDDCPDPDDGRGEGDEK